MAAAEQGMNLLKKLWLGMCGIDIIRHLLTAGVVLAFPQLQRQLIDQAGGLPETATRGLSDASISLALQMAGVLNGLLFIVVTLLIGWAGLALMAKREKARPFVRTVAIGAAGYFALRVVLLFVPQESASIATLAPTWVGLTEGALQILSGVAAALCVYMFTAGETGKLIRGTTQPKE